MEIINLLPEFYVEHEYFKEMEKHLDEFVFRGKKVVIAFNHKELPEYSDI